MVRKTKELNTDVNQIKPVESKKETGTAILKDNNNKKYGLYKGLIYSSLSSVFSSLSSVIIKHIKEVDPVQLSLNGSIGVFIITIPHVIYFHQNFFGPKRFWHLLVIRGIVGSTNTYLRFISYRYLPLGEASLIASTAPVFVAIFARIFLKEPCKIIQVIVLCISMVGVFLITRMPLVIAEGIIYSKEQVMGVSAAVVATLFLAFVYILVRRVNVLHCSVIMFNFGWVSIIEQTIITYASNGFDVPKCGTDQWLVILLAISLFLTTVLMTLSIQQEQAAPIAMIKGAMDIILAFLWQIFFFGEIPDVYSISGAILISLGVLIIGLSKWVLSVPEDSIIRKKLNIFTL